MECVVSECENSAGVRLHVPWAETRSVCPAHARVLARQDGVVAEPLEGSKAHWP